MKTSFQLLSAMVLSVILGVGIIGCDSNKSAEQSANLINENISDSELEKAAAADMAIAEIKYQLYLDGKAAGPTAYDAVAILWEEAEKKKAETLKNIGIDLQTYKNIMMQVRLNEDVGKRYQEIVERMPSKKQQEMQ